jgi:hypothetical protein
MLLLPVILMVPDVCGGVMANVILNVCPLPDIVRMMIRLRSMRWAGHVEYAICKINAYKVLIGRTEGKKSPGRLGIRGDY